MKKACFNKKMPQRKKSVGASGWGVGAPQPNANGKLAVCPQPNPTQRKFLKTTPNPTQRNFGRNLQPWLYYIKTVQVFFKGTMKICVENTLIFFCRGRFTRSTSF